jgi:lipopolysaccharide transport system ATP-binding protein
MSLAIRFDRVSKSFRLDNERSRSFQELFLSLFRRREQAQAFWALRDVSFDIMHGETVGLVGRNGAGKSTTLKMISRIILPKSGQVTINGRVTALLELGAGFHPELSGRDNVYLNGAVMGMTRKEVSKRLDQIIEFAEIRDFIDVPVKDYSSGMYARLGFSVAVHFDPQILLVDEALSVGDQAFQAKCSELMLKLRKRGITMLYVSHSLASIEQVCARAIWLDKGQVRMDDSAARVANAYHVHSLERSLNPTDPDGTDRPGSGEARVTRVELLDKTGQSPDYFATGDMVTIRVHYMTYQQVERPQIGLGFFSQPGGMHLSGPNSALDRFVIPSFEGQGYVDYTISHLPILPGEVQIVAAIYDWDGIHCYDHLENAARLRIAPGGTRERYGVLTFNGRWGQG